MPKIPGRAPYTQVVHFAFALPRRVEEQSLVKDVGIVGLPLSGKTTLFNALTRAGLPTGGAAGKANVAAVPVPDRRVDVLAGLARSRKRVFVQVRFVDVVAPAGGKGTGLSAQALGALREVDALAMVLAAFGGTDPAEAAADVNLELTVADLGSIAGGADKAVKRAKAGVKDAALEADTLVRAQDLLDAGTPLRSSGPWACRRWRCPPRWRRRRPSSTRRTRPSS